jgi:hypothetical protein
VSRFGQNDDSFGFSLGSSFSFGRPLFPVSASVLVSADILMAGYFVSDIHTVLFGFTP